MAPNLLATGTDDSSFNNASQCLPIADFYKTETEICPGDQVQYFNNSYNSGNNTAFTFNWTFPGGVPNTSTDRNPVVTYNNSGKYDVSMVMSNSVGNSQPVVKTNYTKLKASSGTFKISLTLFLSFKIPQ